MLGSSFFLDLRGIRGKRQKKPKPKDNNQDTTEMYVEHTHTIKDSLDSSNLLTKNCVMKIFHETFQDQYLHLEPLTSLVCNFCHLKGLELGLLEVTSLNSSSS